MKRWVPLIALLLSACAGVDPRCPAMPEGRYCLQPGNAATNFQVQQNVHLRYGARDERMIALVEADERALNFAGFSPFGQKILQLQCSGSGATSTLSPHDRLDPAQLCALLQWTLWPAESVRAGLQAPLRLEENVQSRRIYANDTLIFSARYAEGNAPFDRMTLQLPTLDLRLDIEKAAQ